MAWVYGLATFAIGGALVFWRWSKHWNEYAGANGATVRRWRAPKLGPGSGTAVEPEVSVGALGVLQRNEMRAADVVVLIIDLARRGYLQIEQIARPNDKGRGGEWALNRKPLTQGQIDALAPFESRLIARLFGAERSVRVNALRRSFGPSFVAVQNAVYSDLVAQGFFRQEPLDVKVAWRRAASFLLLGSAFAWVLLQSVIPHPIAVAVGVFALGVAVAVLSNHVGGRTARGSSAVAQAEALREFLITGTPEPTGTEFAGIYERYAPWALALGVAEEWTQTCQGLVAAEGGLVMAGVLDWYRVPAWTLEEVSEVSPAEFSSQLVSFYEHTTRVIGNSKADKQER